MHLYNICITFHPRKVTSSKSWGGMFFCVWLVWKVKMKSCYYDVIAKRNFQTQFAHFFRLTQLMSLFIYPAIDFFKITSCRPIDIIFQNNNLIMSLANLTWSNQFNTRAEVVSILLVSQQCIFSFSCQNSREASSRWRIFLFSLVNMLVCGFVGWFVWRLLATIKKKRYRLEIWYTHPRP